MPRDYAAPNRGFPEVYVRPGVAAELSMSEEWFGFVNRVAKEVRKEHPGVYLATNGYANRTTPPEGVTLGDHPVVMFAAIWSDTLHAFDDAKSWQAVRQGQMLRRWARMCPNVWVYNYDHTMLVTALTPVPRVSKLRRDMPLMKQWGVMGFHNEARNVWMEEGILTRYVRGRLGWNAGADVDAIADDYYRTWYGPAAGAGRAFWDALERTIRETPLLGHEDRILPFVYSAALVRELEGRVAEAERIAGAEPYAKRVRVDRLTLEHLKGYLALSEAEFAGDFAAAARHGRKMMEQRAALHAISPFLVTPLEKGLTSGVFYWGVEDRVRWYEGLNDKVTGKTGRLVAMLPVTANFRTDPHDDGRFELWHEPGYVEGAEWKAVKTTEPFYVHGHADQQGRTYLGNVWYRLRVELPADAGKAVKLLLPTVEGEAWCWVNGQFAGHRPFRDAYERPNEMEVEVGPWLRPGQANVIAVRVNTGLNQARAAGGLLGRGVLYAPAKGP